MENRINHQPTRLSLQFFAEDIAEGEFEDDFDFEEDNTSVPEVPEESALLQDRLSQDSLPQDSSPPAIEERHRIVYNGEEKELTIEELSTLAQKGMNYDKVLSERDGLRNSKEAALVAKLASGYGMTTEQYIAEVERQEMEQQLQAQMEQGLPREVAERLISLEQKEKERNERDILQQQEAAQKQQYLDFVAAYPDVKALPPEVVEAVAGGVPVSHAYMAYENKQLKQKLGAYEKNKTNADKSTGSLKGELANEDMDDFMRGFDNA